jgi:hypothetical protein
LGANVINFITGVPNRAESIPFEPDLDNAGVGSGDTKTIIRAISYVGRRVWLFYIKYLKSVDKSVYSNSEFFFGYVKEKFARWGVRKNPRFTLNAPISQQLKIF